MTSAQLLAPAPQTPMPSSLGVAASMNATVSFQAGLSGTYALSTPSSYLAGG